MDEVKLSLDEWQARKRACSRIWVTGPTSLFFRYFLIGRLEEGHPRLVAKIRRLDVSQLDLLWEEIREHQHISNW